MLRISLLSVAGAVIFAGLAAFFYVPGTFGILLGIALPVLGVVLLWVIERRTRQYLDVESRWNQVMKADGEDLIERDD